MSIMSSDAQAMGRIGEVVIRTWQTAHQMKLLRGALPGDGRNDNLRARRYVAKYTIARPSRTASSGRSGRLSRARWPTWSYGSLPCSECGPRW